MNCVSKITNYGRAMKQSAFYPFCPHPYFILFVRIRILLFLSASAFYPFCPHPHFIPFVRIRILSLLSASAFLPFCPHPHSIPFGRPSACPSVRPCPRFIPTRANIAFNSNFINYTGSYQVFEFSIKGIYIQYIHVVIQQNLFLQPRSQGFSVRTRRDTRKPWSGPVNFAF